MIKKLSIVMLSMLALLSLSFCAGEDNNNGLFFSVLSDMGSGLNNLFTAILPIIAYLLFAFAIVGPFVYFLKKTFSNL